MSTDWIPSRLSELISHQKGFAFKSIEYRPVGHPIVRVSNFTNRSINMSDCYYLDLKEAAQYDNYKLLRRDVVIATVGSWPTNPDSVVGKTVMVPEEAQGALLNQNAVRLRAKENLDQRFLFYLLKQPDFQFYILGTAQGSASQASIKLTDIFSFQFLRPPLPEQQVISATLGALDDKIELNRKTNETLKAMARAIFKDWFVDFGPTRAKMQGGAPYLSPDIWSLFPDRLDDEGTPEGWELRPVRDFAELRGGKQLEKERITSVGTIPVFGGAGIMGFTDAHNAEGFVISVGRVGAYCGQFFSHRGKAWINNNASLIQQFEWVSGEWLFESLKHADIEVIKKGAAQPFVSNTDVGNMPIIWPGEHVVARFADIAGPLMLRIEHNEAEASSLATTRDFLLPKLMSGEVRVRAAEDLIGEAAWP